MAMGKSLETTGKLAETRDTAPEKRYFKDFKGHSLRGCEEDFDRQKSPAVETVEQPIQVHSALRPNGVTLGVAGKKVIQETETLAEKEDSAHFVEAVLSIPNDSIVKNLKRKSDKTDVVQFVQVGKVRVPLFSWIDINPTELCNRKCVFCPRSDGYENANLHLDLNLANKIASELEEIEYTGTINICGNGEPLLHKDISGLVSCFKNFQVEIVTNGDKLNVELIKDLYANGLKYFVVSMYDGPEQIQKFINLFDSAGITSDRYILRDRWHSEDKNYGLVLTNRAGVIKGGDEMTLPTICQYMHYSMQIDWNGDVLFCVQSIYDKSITFGNLNYKNMLDIWISKKMDDYRKRLGEGNRSHHPCEKCNAMGILHGHKHKIAWDEYSKELNVHRAEQVAYT